MPPARREVGGGAGFLFDGFELGRERRVGLERQGLLPGGQGAVHFFGRIVEEALQAVGVEGVVLVAEERPQGLLRGRVALALDFSDGEHQQQAGMVGGESEGAAEALGGRVAPALLEVEASDQGQRSGSAQPRRLVAPRRFPFEFRQQRRIHLSAGDHAQHIGVVERRQVGRGQVGQGDGGAAPVGPGVVALDALHLVLAEGDFAFGSFVVVALAALLDVPGLEAAAALENNGIGGRRQSGEQKDHDQADQRVHSGCQPGLRPRIQGF